MSSTLSFLNLHLQCRLRIADLNNDITILRIYHDYLQELGGRIDRPDLKERVIYAEQSFPLLRQDIDELKNELHLLKMRFGTYARENRTFDKAAYKATTHPLVEKRFTAFRKVFKQLRKELSGLEKLN